MSLPIDHVHRTRATEELGTSIALAAGAGSGKTTVLTQRVLRLLQSGVPPRRIAAITFTEKAAGEIRARVREAVEDALQSAHHPTLETVLQTFGELQLSTIHSFCRTLLLAESLAAQWAPDTELFDGASLAPIVRSAVRRWRPGFEARHPKAALLIQMSATSNQVAEAALTLVSYRDLTPIVSRRTFAFSEQFTDLELCLDGIETAISQCVAPDTDKLVQNNQSLVDALKQWCSEPPEDGVTRALLSSERGSLAGGRKADWPQGKDVFKEAIAAFRQWRVHAFEELHALLVTDMVTHLVPIVDAAKASSAVAQHDDLLFRARQLLSDDPGARVRLASRFDAVLIDEVQDTDPLQAEIALLLTRPEGSDGVWDAHAPLPGRLFAVGDPKQSIYRFRRADVETWNRLVHVVEREGAGLALRQNFRSVPGIVKWVNHTFQAMPGYHPQAPFRPPEALAPVVCLFMDDIDDEAEAIARHLWSLRHDNHLKQWSDVMVLLPAWTHGDALQQTLATFDIPASIEGGRGFFGREEIKLALAAMAALEEPSEGHGMVEVLRGWFAVTLEDIAAHVDAGGALRYTVPNPPNGPVGHGMKVLSRLHRARGRMSWVHLLEQVMEEARVQELYALLPDGSSRLANLDKLFGSIRDLEAAGMTSAEVLEDLQGQARQNNDSIQSRDEPRHDAVRITSVFKAKGLEAPVVVVARNQRSAPSFSVAVDRVKGAFGIAISADLKPAGWEALRTLEKQAYEQERQRWMYVATTRARDQLVLPYAANARSCLTNEWLAELGLKGAPGALHDSDVEVADGVLVRSRDWRELAPPPRHDGPFGRYTAGISKALGGSPVSDVEGAQWQRARQASIRRSVRASPRFKTATQAAHTHRVPPGTSTGIGALAGTVIHDVLNHLDLTLPPRERHQRATEWMDLLAPHHGLAQEQREPCQEALLRILSHEVFDTMAQAPEVWKEVPFAFQERGTQIHGIIDCCFPTNEAQTRWVVVDWKSDLPLAGSPARKNYERQIALYARALLATLTPCEHVEALLVGPHPELGLPDEADLALDSVEEALRPVLERLLARGVEAPEVGTELDGIPVELQWTARKLLVVLDPDEETTSELESLGFTVLGASTDDVDWPERVEDGLRLRLVAGEGEE